MTPKPPKKSASASGPPATLWVSSHALDRQMLDYTAAEDRLWDARLLACDIGLERGDDRRPEFAHDVSSCDWR